LMPGMALKKYSSLVLLNRHSKSFFRTQWLTFIQ
jgi:hypothetical protein